MSRVLETFAPRRLGVRFRWLLASAWVGNLGDGFALAAGPLLVASRTRSPTLVALATLLQRLPWLTFGVLAGAVADRFDRVRIVVASDSIRAVAFGGLALVIAAGDASIAFILAALFVLGATDVFSNTASVAMVPALVDRDDLTVANTRLQGGVLTLNQLVGPPLGAGLFAASVSLPFGAQAGLVALSVALVSRVKLRAPQARPDTRMRAEIADGFRWVTGNPAVRTLVLTIFTFNVTFGAAWAVLVLYARQRLGMGAVGFGLLTTAGAVGGMVATASYVRITKRVSLGNLMRIGLIFETFTHLAFALNRMQAVAFVIMFFFGAHAFIWGTTSITVRQRAVPVDLQGRVTSINAIGSYAGLVVGAGVAGPIASQWGITAPFWFAFVGSAMFVLIMWRQFSHIAHDEASCDHAVQVGLTKSSTSRASSTG